MNIIKRIDVCGFGQKQQEFFFLAVGKRIA